ncbi:MAG: mannitol-1-phosphate 5-dehydrogenase [Lysinibacillus sp.]
MINLNKSQATTSLQKPQAVHFGAGNIGRGFIGLMLTKSGYDVTFVTRNKKKISELQQRNEYPVNLASQHKERILVQNVTAVSSQNKNAVAKHIAKAHLITTAVGVSNLPNIASKIALGICYRFQTNNTEPLHIIACENAIQSSTKLKKSVYEHLPKEYHDKASRFVAFPNTVVDRIVPTKHHIDPLEVTVEPYYEWVIDRSAMLEGLPPIEGVQLVDSLEAFIERKLFTVNTGHCSIAYLGYLNGYTTIHEVMTDPKLLTNIKKVMQETGDMLIEKHDFDEQEHIQYIHKTLKRFANPYLTDDIVRVGRSPIRKLSINDRLVRPTLLTYNLGLDVSNLTNALAAALLYDHAEDPEALELKQAIQKHTIHEVIVKYLGIPSTHPIHKKIAKKYLKFKNMYSLIN